MYRTCEDCHEPYDDAECTTICPHRLLMPRRELEQKKQGVELVGKRVKFRGPGLPGHPNEPHLVQACGWDGMLTLEGFVGEFAPHLFEVVP